MKKYSNNFSIITNYYSQTRRKRSILRITGMVKKKRVEVVVPMEWERERERENQPGRRSFHRGIGTMGKKNGKLIG